MATDATLVGIHDTPGHDTLVPDPQVQKEFSVTAMSIWRWDRDPALIKLGWPPPIRIRSRKFRSRTALENFKRVMGSKGDRAAWAAVSAYGPQTDHLRRVGKVVVIGTGRMGRS